MPENNERLEWILIRLELMDQASAAEAVADARRTNQSLWEYLIAEQLVDPQVLLEAVKPFLHPSALDLASVSVSVEAREALPKDLASYYCALPIRFVGRLLILAVPSLRDSLKLDDLRIVIGRDIRPLEAAESEIRAAIERVYARIAGT